MLTDLNIGDLTTVLPEENLKGLTQLSDLSITGTVPEEFEVPRLLDSLNLTQYRLLMEPRPSTLPGTFK